MSALAGLIRFSGQTVDERDLAAAIARLAAPGVGPAQTWCQAGAGLAVRQRVSTPQDRFERQPWIGGGGRFVLVCDGRLDNRDAMIEALNLSPGSANTVPDGALLLAALERWGEAALKRFTGEFALAFWDAAERRLLLARDPLGRRSLYVHYGQGFVAFATTLPALMCLPGVPRRLNEERLAGFLVLNFQFTEETLYRDLCRLPPATAVIIGPQGRRQERYWSFDPRRRVRLGGDDDYVDAMREHLDRAAACCLRAQRPVAAQMSGGLDSSAVAATAARQLAPDPLLALTAVPPPDLTLPDPPPRWYADETPYVRAIARMHPNMDLRLISSTAVHPLENDPVPVFEAGGLPSFGMMNVGWFAPLVESARQAGASVMLTGGAGNAAWSWHGLQTLRDLFRQGRWIRLMRELDATGKDRGGAAGLAFERVLKPMLPAWLPRTVRRWRRGHAQPWSQLAAINPQFAGDTGLNRNGGQRLFPGDSRPHWQIRLDMLTSIIGSDGRVSMRALTGMDVRDPLADLRLVEFCLSIPAEQFLRGGVTRWLTRRALADRLPASVIDNSRLGQQNPEWFVRLTARHPQMLEELAQLERSALARRVLDLPRLSRILRNWPEDTCDEVTYHRLLPRALHIGRFLLWQESGELFRVPA